jgi:hypothetical protein
MAVTTIEISFIANVRGMTKGQTFDTLLEWADNYPIRDWKLIAGVVFIYPTLEEFTKELPEQLHSDYEIFVAKQSEPVEMVNVSRAEYEELLKLKELTKDPVKYNTEAYTDVITFPACRDVTHDQLWNWAEHQTVLTIEDISIADQVVRIVPLSNDSYYGWHRESLITQFNNYFSR